MGFARLKECIPESLRARAPHSPAGESALPMMQNLAIKQAAPDGSPHSANGGTVALLPEMEISATSPTYIT